MNAVIDYFKSSAKLVGFKKVSHIEYITTQRDMFLRK